MARPLKIGLDYFSFDVNFFQNKKVRRLKLACGAQSITVLLNLLCNIYRDKGYYIEWDEDLPFLIADEIGISEGAALEAIKKAVQVKFFDPRLAEKGILTSKEIQARYSKICKDAKRTNWEISEEYNLLPEETIVTTGKTPEETKLPPEESTQSKVKESKEEIYIHTGEPENSESYTEKEFLERWSAARKHYDKKPTNLTKLKFHDRSVFNELLKSYEAKDFDKAISGLFFQKTFPHTRIQPTHFLENFEMYLDCWNNNEKLYEGDKRKIKKDML